MTVYVVEHIYDEDGIFGEVIPSNDVVAIFETENEANEFVNKYSDAHVYYVYDEPYESLSCGILTIIPVETGKYDESKFWWVR